MAPGKAPARANVPWHVILRHVCKCGRQCGAYHAWWMTNASATSRYSRRRSDRFFTKRTHTGLENKYIEFVLH